MKWILDSSEVETLRAYCRRESLLVFDYDGTLSPIVADPSEAHMRLETRELLAAVARLYPVAILSGRSRHEVMKFVDGIRVLDVIGNHGLEVFGAALGSAVGKVREWRQELEERLEGLAGVVLEDKRCSLAVHYRGSTDPAAARQVIRRVASDLEGARLIGGKQVVNIVIANAPDKGAALRRLRERLASPPTVFVGDDETDEDAFILSGTSVLGIRVGLSETSSAPFFLQDQNEIDQLLGRLIEGVRPGAAPTSRFDTNRHDAR
jgi:trehalose 6-phosphate phosphatase